MCESIIMIKEGTKSEIKQAKQERWSRETENKKQRKKQKKVGQRSKNQLRHQGNWEDGDKLKKEINKC